MKFFRLMWLLFLFQSLSIDAFAEDDELYQFFPSENPGESGWISDLAEFRLRDNTELDGGAYLNSKAYLKKDILASYFGMLNRLGHDLALEELRLAQFQDSGGDESGPPPPCSKEISAGWEQLMPKAVGYDHGYFVDAYCRLSCIPEKDLYSTYTPSHETCHQKATRIYDTYHSCDREIELWQRFHGGSSRSMSNSGRLSNFGGGFAGNSNLRFNRERFPINREETNPLNGETGGSWFPGPETITVNGSNGFLPPDINKNRLVSEVIEAPEANSLGEALNGQEELCKKARHFIAISHIEFHPDLSSANDIINESNLWTTKAPLSAEELAAKREDEERQKVNRCMMAQGSGEKSAYVKLQEYYAGMLPYYITQEFGVSVKDAIGSQIAASADAYYRKFFNELDPTFGLTNCMTSVKSTGEKFSAFTISFIDQSKEDLTYGVVSAEKDYKEVVKQLDEIIKEMQKEDITEDELKALKVELDKLQEIIEQYADPELAMYRAAGAGASVIATSFIPYHKVVPAVKAAGVVAKGLQSKLLTSLETLASKVKSVVGSKASGVLSSTAAVGATSSDKVRQATQLLSEYLGKGAKIKTNSAGDKIFLSADGTRKVRFDIINPHGDKPHMHLQKLTSSGRWVDEVSGMHRIRFDGR